MDCMALEDLVYGCTCACVMYVHFFFFSVLFYLSCHASGRRFFFLFKRVFPVYFSQSVPYAHTLSRSHCLLLLLLSANFSPFHSFLYTPPFFSPHLLRPIHVFPPCTNQVSPCHLQEFCYSLSWWATGTCAPWSGGKNWPDLHNNRKCQIYRVYTIMMHSRTLSVSQGLSVIGQRVHAKAVKMELFMIDSGMQTEPCSLASSP